MKNIIESFKKALGSYSGEGINHEKEKFIGNFDLQEILGGRGFQIKFEAKSPTVPATIYHCEVSTVAPNISNGLSLFNLNTNIPFLAEHTYIEGLNPNHLIFRFGYPASGNSFRQEVHLHLGENEIRYEYHWGMPGGDFEYRSGASMRPMRHLS